MYISMTSTSPPSYSSELWATDRWISPAPGVTADGPGSGRHDDP